MFYVYIIKSKTTGRYYIGSSCNTEDRLKQHNEGRTKTTRGKGPYQLVHKEEFAVKREALKRERQIKKYKGGRAFKKLVNASSPSSSLA